MYNDQITRTMYHVAANCLFPAEGGGGLSGHRHHRMKCLGSDRLDPSTGSDASFLLDPTLVYYWI